MSALAALLVYAQALGALGGSLAAVWGEIVYLRAKRDGHIDAAERRHLHIIAASLRYGMFFMLLASFGLVIVSYQSGAVLQPALTSSYWMFMVLALLIVYLAWHVSRHTLSHTTGSALIFSTWWFLAFLSLGLIPALSFGALVGLYLASSLVFFGVLQYVRMFFIRR